LCALGGLLLLITIIESLIKIFSRPGTPPPTPSPPPVPAPPPGPGPAPQPAPGNPGGFPAFTCNCYCPPVYYPPPAPPQQTPKAYQKPEDPWGIYTDSPIVAEVKEHDQPAQPELEKVLQPEIPSI
jgi:hypothetical protein